MDLFRFPLLALSSLMHLFTHSFTLQKCNKATPFVETPSGAIKSCLHKLLTGLVTLGRLSDSVNLFQLLYGRVAVSIKNTVCEVPGVGFRLTVLQRLAVAPALKSSKPPAQIRKQRGKPGFE